MRPRRGAEALGYGMQSPPARAMPDYLFKDHNFGLHSAESVRVARLGRTGQGSTYLRTAIVLASWFPVLSSQFLVLGSRFLVPGSLFPVLSSWFLVPGSRFLVPGSRFSEGDQKTGFVVS